MKNGEHTFSGLTGDFRFDSFCNLFAYASWANAVIQKPLNANLPLISQIWIDPESCFSGRFSGKFNRKSGLHAPFLLENSSTILLPGPSIHLKTASWCSRIGIRCQNFDSSSLHHRSTILVTARVRIFPNWSTCCCRFSGMSAGSGLATVSYCFGQFEEDPRRLSRNS